MTDPAEKKTGSDLFVEALEEYNVRHVFGNPGTTELPVVNALTESDIEYVLGLHEDIAVGMAAGYATTLRYCADEIDTCPVGVANLHIAPGVAHGLSNLYGAKVAGAPVIVTAGNHSTSFEHEEPILSGDLVEMTDQFTKWSAEVQDVSALPTMLRRAFRTALSPPTGPVFLCLPIDVMMEETDEEVERLGSIPSAGRGDPSAVEEAADLIVEADKPVLVLGDHVARNSHVSEKDGVESAVRLAETSGARVHAEILASEVNFPADHEQWLSYIPPDEDLASTLMNTDTVIFVGCSTNTTLVEHEKDLVSDESTLIHIGDEAWELGKNQPADVSVIGDPGYVMDEVAELVEGRINKNELKDRLEFVEQTKAMVEHQMEEMGVDEKEDDSRSSKAELVDTMREVVDDAYIVDESTTSRYALLTRWPFDKEQFVANKGGGLGYGLPAAVGGALGEDVRSKETKKGTRRDVIGFIGDGSYLYYPQTVYSAARYGIDLTVVIPDNRNYRILKDNTLDLMGGEEDDYDFTEMEFEPPVDIVKDAESYGADAESIETPDEIEEGLETALEKEGVSVLDVLVHD